MTATARITEVDANAGRVPCACAGFVAVDLLGAKRTTGCVSTTKRTFAPGHDARLKGFLIRAGAEGLLIRTPEGGDLRDAMTIADRFGFGTMVVAGIKAAQSRAFAKLIKDTKKQAKATHETPKQVTCKVGRWTYEGVITDDPMNGPKFTYTNAKGLQTTTPKFTRV
jgi:hypothetical protein